MLGGVLMRQAIALLALSSIAAFFSGSRVLASYIPPASFPAGTTEYQILFVTSGSVSSEISNIATYNAFATSSAALDPSLPATTWDAIVSTASVYTNTNAPSSAGIPVYNTAGQLITNLGLYTGNILSALPQYDENGNLAANEFTLTGSDYLGYPDNPAGTVNGRTLGYTSLGNTGESIAQWIEYGFSGYNYSGPIFALSAPISLAASPEPASMTLLGAGFLAIGGFALRRRGQLATR
jgi:hypothetical protein